VKPGGQAILRELLKDLAGAFDLAILDCPPSLGLYTTSALCAAQWVLAPVPCTPLALSGLAQGGADPRGREDYDAILKEPANASTGAASRETNCMPKKKTSRADALAGMYTSRPIDTLGGEAVAKARAHSEQPAAPVRRAGSRGPLPKGLEGVMIRMERWQAAALRRIANERAGEELKRGAARIVRADYSEIVRESVATWLAENDPDTAGRKLAASWLKASEEGRQEMRR